MSNKTSLCLLLFLQEHRYCSPGAPFTNPTSRPSPVAIQITYAMENHDQSSKTASLQSTSTLVVLIPVCLVSFTDPIRASKLAVQSTRDRGLYSPAEKSGAEAMLGSISRAVDLIRAAGRSASVGAFKILIPRRRRAAKVQCSIDLVESSPSGPQVMK